jgi:hypothetical protein
MIITLIITIIINVINIIRIIIDHNHNQYMTDLHNSITIPPQEIHNLADYKPGGLQNLLISSQNSSNQRFHHQIIDFILILAIAIPPSISNKLFTLQNSEHFDK